MCQSFLIMLFVLFFQQEDRHGLYGSVDHDKEDEVPYKLRKTYALGEGPDTDVQEIAGREDP